MSYIFNIEVFHNNACIGQIEDFCSMDTTLDEWTANTLVERARKDKEWDYYCITCFEESKDGTQTLKNKIKVNNEENPLTVKIFGNSAAPAWHVNFIEAADAWKEKTNAKSNNKTIAQQYADAMELNLNIVLTEEQNFPIEAYSFCYTWLTAEDRTAFSLKY